MYLQSNPVSVEVTESQILPVGARRYFGFQNQDGANPVYLVFNSAENTGERVATADNNGILVLAGEFYHIETKAPIMGEVRAISTGGTVLGTVITAQ
tara:strand:+ start:243 stop:533 length:291 start_codon:yes stop_codon:yes gene_type:complete